jgi:GMP synthase (glutamine-hydrolysing)
MQFAILFKHPNENQCFYHRIFRERKMWSSTERSCAWKIIPRLNTMPNPTPKTVAALRHLAFEDLGLIEPFLIQRGWRVRYYDVGVNDLYAMDIRNADLLVILGGPIGAEDDALYPFLADEVSLIKERLTTKKPILGICLGAQLMARSLGASVKPMRQKEIGYSPVTLTESARKSPLVHIGKQTVLHWHGDQFSMPHGVESLASTSACPHQAFMIDSHAMAWQFHLEVDAKRIEQWLIGHCGELSQMRIDRQQLRVAANLHSAKLKKILALVMQDWLALNGLI